MGQCGSVDGVDKLPDHPEYVRPEFGLSTRTISNSGNAEAAMLAVGIGSVAYLMKKDLRTGSGMLRQNMKTIRGWLEEQSASASRQVAKQIIRLGQSVLLASRLDMTFTLQNQSNLYPCCTLIAEVVLRI